MGADQAAGERWQRARSERCAKFPAIPYQGLSHSGQGTKRGLRLEEKEDVWDKVHEELEELKAELAKGDKENSTQELGDFLFSVINAARLYKLNPDNALEKTNQKFIRRFNYVEDHSLKQGKNLKDMSLEEMDKLWDEAKKQERLQKES